MLTAKLIINRVMLPQYSKFRGTDKKIYLIMPMSQYEYMRLPIDIIPQDIIDEYQLMNKVKMASSFVKSDK